MVKLPWPSTDDVLLALAWSWVDVLGEADYERVYREIGYARAFGGGAEAIQREIKRYRDMVYFPGETVFSVTDRHTAKGGNPTPMVLVQRFVPMESLPIVASVDVDLPLNGKWSRLRATFVAFASPSEQDTAVLSLEDFWSPQDQDEAEGQSSRASQ